MSRHSHLATADRTGQARRPPLLASRHRQLLVMAGIAGANHGLVPQAEAIFEAIEFLAPPEEAAVIRGLLCGSLGRIREAFSHLAGTESVDGQALRLVLTELSQTMHPMPIGFGSQLG